MKKSLALASSLFLLVSSCAKPPPANPYDACAIFSEHRAWYPDIQKAEKKWSIPKYVILSFVHQESSFVHNAKPPRGKIFGFIPWFRKSSATGYPQAKDETWEQYKKENKISFASRNDFSDSVDFIAWYNRKSVSAVGLSPTDARNLYLAYHEGWSGYRSGRWRQNPKLRAAADKVSRLAESYRRQLQKCGKSLELPWYKSLFAI